MDGCWKEGRGVLKAKHLEAMYENKLEFPGGREGCKTKNLLWGEYGYFLELHIQGCSGKILLLFLDRKLCVKARLTGALQVTMNVVKNNTTFFKVLQPALQVLKLYSANCESSA